MGKEAIITLFEKTVGVLTDYAADQKKLVQLIREWKIALDQEARGERALAAASHAVLLPLLWAE